MEEILASIRRIIADDQAAKPAEVPVAAPEPDDVLDLAEVAEPVTRPRVVEPEPEPEPAPDLLDFDAIDFEDPVTAAPEPEPEPLPEPEPAPEPPPPPPPQPVLQAARA
ncbi:hypothetical protein SB3_10525, partial [Methylobacterium radiotolerans]